MKILLDTHVAIWSVAYTRRIPRHILNMLSDGRNEIFVSAASIWEMTIKKRGGRRDAPPIAGQDAINAFGNAGYEILDVTAEHAAAIEGLRIKHADPFDLLILAQAMTEPLRLVTVDARLADYDRTIISW